MTIRFGRVRSPAEVKQDFKDKEVRAGWLTRRRLSYYLEDQYGQVLSLAEKYAVDRLKVDPIKKFQEVDLTRITEKDLRDRCLTGKHDEILDFRGLQAFLETRALQAAKDEYLGVGVVEVKVKELLQLMTILTGERKMYEQLAEKPDATPDKLFRALAQGVEKFKALGFHVAIFLPLEAIEPAPETWRWQEYIRAEKWGQDGYTGSAGAVPLATLRSVLCSPNRRFLVRIDDPASYAAQGLDYDRERMSFDLEHSKGSPDRLIYKLETPDREPFAVVHVHNRVGNDKPAKPPEQLFPDGEADLLREGLNSYFDTVERCYDRIRERLRLPSRVNLGSRETLSNVEKMEILDRGKLIKHQGRRIRLIEVPSEKVFRKIGGVVNWLREEILKVYEGTTIAAGKTRDQLIRALSLEDEKMLERVIYARYWALIEGDEAAPWDLGGLVTGTVLEINQGEQGVVFKVPEAMIKKSMRGRSLEVALSYEMAFRVFRQRWAEIGFIKGFFHMLNKGLPIYVTTQSLRVARGMMRLKNLSLLRTVRGRELTPEQKLIIRFCSPGKADARGVEREAYGGRVSIDEEEAGIMRTKEEQKIETFFRQELAGNARLHLVGYGTIGVAIRVGLELALNNLRRRLFG